MYRQYSSRIQRKRGIKVKHALRICILVAVCFWLIYQVKHFHEDSDAKGSIHGGSSGGLIKIRRKDLRSIYHGNLTENQETEEEETTEAVENNLEEVSSTDKKVEEEDEALGDGDGETDEHEVKKLGTKFGREDHGVDNSAAEGKVTDDGNGGWQEDFVEDGDRGDKTYSEAGEESYNADEASSAVTRDNHMRTTENENEVGISGLRHEKILEQESKENPDKEAFNGEMKKRLEVDGDGKSEDTNPSSATDIVTNVTTSETKENNLDIPEKDSSQNNTLTESHNATLEASNINTTDVTTQDPKLPGQNVTRSRPELDHDQRVVTKGTSTEGSNVKAIITLELANISTLDVEDNQSDSNSTAAKNSESDFEDFSEPSNNTDSFTFRSNHSQLEDGTNTRESVTSNGTDEVLESAITGNPKKVHTVSTDLSDIQSSDSSLR